MGELMPVRRLPAQEKWQAADAEVWVAVSEYHGYHGCAVEFTRTQGGAYARITPADNYEPEAVCHDSIAADYLRAWSVVVSWPSNC